MAIRPVDAYPGQTDPADPGYPHGKAQNQSLPGDTSGTPLEKAWVNDLWGFQQALLDAAGITSLTEAPDKVGASDYLNAIQALIADAASPIDVRLAALEAALATEGEFKVAIPLRAIPIVSIGSWSRPTVDDHLEGFAEGQLLIPLAGFVPRGARVTQVEATVATGAFSGTSRMNLAYNTQAFGNVQSPVDNKMPHTTFLQNVYADASGGEQTLTITPNHTMGVNAPYLKIKASAASGALVADKLRGILVTYTRSGL